MTLTVLPVTSDPNQTFEVSLPIDGRNRRLKFFFNWNPIGQYWQFDLYDQNNEGIQLLSNMPVYSIDYPYNNIILRYEYKEVGSLYVVNVGDSTSFTADKPNLNNLGSEWLMIWGDTPYV
jgi:hypothetical protein